MDCLELNIRQRILSDLATVETETEDFLIILNQSKAQVGGEKHSAHNCDSGEDEVKFRGFMSEASAHYNIAFGEHVANFPEEHLTKHIPVLTDLLHNVPRVVFDQCLSWDEWALPDQLVFSTVSALLRICGAHPDYADRVVTSIIAFVTDVIANLKESTSIDVLTHFTPSIHGLYRAITSTLYPWTASQWRLLSESLQSLVATPVLERINHLLLDATSIAYCHTFISRYMAFGRPLSGYFTICCVMEMEWTVLAQALASAPLVHEGQPRIWDWRTVMRRRTL
jgi:phosphatidylinositol 4-kinase